LFLRAGRRGLNPYLPRQDLQEVLLVAGRDVVWVYSIVETIFIQGWKDGNYKIPSSIILGRADN